MPKQYLDDNGNPIAAPKQYLDDSGNPIQATAPTESTETEKSHQEPIGFQGKIDAAIANFTKRKTADDIRKEDAAKGYDDSGRARAVANEAEASLGNVARRALGSAASMAVHPLDTLKGGYEMAKELVSAPLPIPTAAGIQAGKDFAANDKGPIAQQVKDFQETYKRSPREAVENLSGDMLGMYLSGKLLDAGGKPAIWAAKKLGRGALDTVTGTGPRTVKDLVKKTKALNEEGAAATAKENLTTAEKAEMLRKNELRAHASEAEKAAAKNQGVQDKLASDLAAQRRIAPIEKKLENARAARRAAVETAREKALKVGNEKYTTVNSKLNHIPSDMAAPSAAYAEAANSFGEVLNQPPLLRRLGSLLEEPAKGETKSPVTYKDEQQLYSELGNELSKGGLNGPTYHAYDLIHEALGKDMQDIADLQGMGKQLSEARNYWRRMKQTFGKPISVNDAATKAIGGVADETRANQIRLLGSFDPAIPRIDAHIANIERGLDAMPKPVPERVLTREAAGKRVPEPKLELTPKPEPKTFAPKKIGEAETQAAQEGALEKRANLISHKASWIAAGPPIYALVDLIKGHGVNLGEVAGVSAGIGALSLGVGRLLENPTVVNFLTKATARDAAQIPVDIRGDFPSVIEAAKKKGIKVSPALLGIAASGHRPAEKGSVAAYRQKLSDMLRAAPDDAQ